MLRKESKEFLEVYWKQNPTPKERKLQQHYKNQNPSGKAIRVVNQINKGIYEIALALEKFPARYREKIEIETAENIFRNRIISSKDQKAKLRLGKELLEEGIDILKKEVMENNLLRTIYVPKFEEIEKLVQLLVKSQTKIPKRSKNGLRKPWEERSLAEVVELSRRD